MDKGTDPRLERQRQEAEEEIERKRLEAEQTGVTVKEALDHYLTTIAPSSAKNAETKFRNSHCNVYRLIGGMKLKDVTEDDLWGLLDRHTNRGKQSEAARLRSYMKAAFNKAKKHRPFKLSRWSNPFLNIEKPEESENVHDRALSSEEIRDFWTLLDESDEALLGVRAVLKLLLILGQRVEETSKMKWSSLDLDAGVWDIPPADNKTGKRTGKGHVVPLPLLAVELIKSMPIIEDEDLVFPGRREGMPFRVEVFSKGLRRTLASHAGDIPIEHFTPRDIRRTVKTHMSRLGVLKEVSDVVQ